MTARVYEIVCSHGLKYIGSTDNLAARKSRHFNCLRKGSHDNRLMQEHFTQYGEQSFSFSIIETTDDIATARQREAFHVRAHAPESLYNKVVFKHVWEKNIFHTAFGQWMKKEKLTAKELGLMLEPPASAATVSAWMTGRAEPKKGHRGQIVKLSKKFITPHHFL